MADPGDESVEILEHVAQMARRARPARASSRRMSDGFAAGSRLRDGSAPADVTLFVTRFMQPNRASNRS
jgi:hypothetical protein